MRLTIKLKLLPSEAEHAVLLNTLELCNEIANELSEYAYQSGIKRKFDLHRAKYREVRAAGLAAQAAIRVISKVADAYITQQGAIRNGTLKGKSLSKAVCKPIVFRKYAGQAYDARNLSINPEQGTISIWTVNGRLKSIPFECSPTQLESLKQYQKGESDLVYEDGIFYLLAGVEIPEPPVREVSDYIGVDSGIVNIATTSDGDNWSGGAVTLRRKKNRRLRSKLQSKGTRSAKRLLKRRRRKETRFVTDVNHQVSKRLVETAERTERGIVLEDLKHIRERVRLRKPQRVELHSWAFAQLHSFILYKARLAGVPVRIINPAYSSQGCPECYVVDKKNRKTRDTFQCVSCGLTGPADVIAAQNLRLFALVEENLMGSVKAPYAAVNLASSQVN